ncbi:MAG: HRDC domain-containing protein, partial [Planctomycetes bacterium]|nr:HRDC domain-containing protein [Planctomycetota bacterium]
WHHESCRSMIKAAAAEKPPADPEDGWRIKGTSKLSRHQLAFIREISKWRISLAQSSDLPPFKIMSNTQIIALAISSANNADSDIPQEIKLPRNCRGRRLSKLKKAIAKANDTPQAKWPKLRKSAPKQRHRPDCKPLIDAIYTKCASLAQQLAIPPHIIAPRAAIINIAYNRPKTTEQIMTAGPLMHWQAQLLKPEITNILSNH